jgi:hypothetical protein
MLFPRKVFIGNQDLIKFWNQKMVDLLFIHLYLFSTFRNVLKKVYIVKDGTQGKP